jgi:hypothetical protein
MHGFGGIFLRSLPEISAHDIYCIVFIAESIHRPQQNPHPIAPTLPYLPD